MFDLTVENGLVLDGTGSPAEPRDIAIRDGRIVEIAKPGTLGPSTRRIDAAGRVVSPGFVDVHTHFDAQVFWDPFLSPSSLHGVTTVIGGNCGFSIAPLSDHDDGYMLMLAEVEAIPPTALAAGAPWDWRSFGEYLDAVEAVGPAVNFGVMAGHSALRRAVLGDRHTEADPGDAAISEMQAMLREALSAGALGFSSSWNSIHLDGEGEPVSSRYAHAEELIALSGELAAYPGTQLEFIPTVGLFSEERIETMIAMSLASKRTLNWNVLIPVDPDVARKQLAVSDLAATRGAAIVALTYPGPTAIRTSKRSALFRSIPGWNELLDLPTDDAVRELRHPDVRDRLRRSAQESGSDLATVIGDLLVTDTHSVATSSSTGRRLGDIATDGHTDAFDALFDLWVDDQFRTGFRAEPIANSAASWAVRLETLHNPRVIIGASDAGAHVEVLSTFDYAVVLLALARERDAITLAEAVQKLTDIPARLYGLEGRGRLVEGAWADVVVFDPGTVGPGAPGWRNDLPGEAGRIYNEPTGIEHVIVNGTEIVGPAGLTGERPGKVLRSGSDTV